MKAYYQFPDQSPQFLADVLAFEGHGPTNKRPGRVKLLLKNAEEVMLKLVRLTNSRAEDVRIGTMTDCSFKLFLVGDDPRRFHHAVLDEGFPSGLIVFHIFPIYADGMFIWFDRDVSAVEECPEPIVVKESP